jgi:hypothetical protein
MMRPERLPTVDEIAAITARCWAGPMYERLDQILVQGALRVGGPTADLEPASLGEWPRPDPPPPPVVPGPAVYTLVPGSDTPAFWQGMIRREEKRLQANARLRDRRRVARLALLARLERA